MKRIKELMTSDPVFCSQESSLEEVAKLMIKNDCGEIIVVDSEDSREPVGVITDRDICCRIIAKNLNPFEMKVADCMSSPCLAVPEDMSLEECVEFMMADQIRRLPVMNSEGELCGIISLADLAQHAEGNLALRAIREISRPSGAASQTPDY